MEDDSPAGMVAWAKVRLNLFKAFVVGISSLVCGLRNPD